MTTWSFPIVKSTTGLRESQVSLAVTLWLSGVVINQTFTSGGVDVHARLLHLLIITAKCFYSCVKFLRLGSTTKFTLAAKFYSVYYQAVGLE